MNRLLYIICAAIIAAASLSACGAAAIPTTAAQPSPSTPAVSDPNIKHPLNPGGNQSASPLVTIKSNGGMCPGGCWSTTEIAADGSYHAADSMGGDRNGALEAAQVTALADLVAKADFAEIKSHPFTGTCPIAYDGQELVFTFHTAAGDETIASCQVAIDQESPLFQALEQALTTIRQ